MGSNRYFVCRRIGAPLEITLETDQPCAGAEIAYHIRAFRILEERYGFSGYVVCFAWGAEQQIPYYGSNVIVVLYGEEHCRIPKYIKQVRTIFTGYGVFPAYRVRILPLRLAQAEVAEFFRNLILWLPNGWRWLLYKSVRDKCIVTPLGYGIPHNFEVKPLSQRKYYVSFQGSLSDPLTTFRRLVGTPKSCARLRLAAVLSDMAKKYGTDKIKLKITGRFQDSMANAANDFAETFQDSIICVAPRGTSRDTLRLYDGLRCGSIIISDRLPNREFFNLSPVIQIGDWTKLDLIVRKLIADPTKMEQIHRQTLEFWRKMASEEALARLYAENLGLAADIKG